jgi:hypothetical protein
VGPGCRELIPTVCCQSVRTVCCLCVVSRRDQKFIAGCVRVDFFLDQRAKVMQPLDVKGFPLVHDCTFSIAVECLQRRNI